MKLTVEQALQQGVAAHKEGKLQDAERLYRAILQSQPTHPDANHNLGVLAVGVGKVAAALPYFKAAVSSNSNQNQFWLSYIDALIKLERINEANDVLDQAKSKGAKGIGFDQIEMRILADMAGVKELKKAFKNNEDIHSLTASQIFNIDIKKVNQDHRRKAKAINFGIIYGISQYGLAKQINVSNYEAEEFLDAYFAKFPEIKVYMDNTIKFCRKSGYVNNIFGRRSHFNGINDKNFNVRNFQERAAINAPIQGSASEIMRLAMIRLDKKLLEQKNIKSKMLLQIHDELIFEVPKKDEKMMVKLIKEEMTSVAQSDYHCLLKTSYLFSKYL